MAYSEAVEDFRKIRRGERPSRIPVCALSEEFDVKWYKRASYREFTQNGEVMYRVIRESIERFDYDWAWVQVDDCFEFEPIGVKVKGEDNIVPATYGYLPIGEEVFPAVRSMNPERDGRMPRKLEAIRKLRRHFQDSVLITGSCAAPFSAAGLMWGLEPTMMLLLDDPKLLSRGMWEWTEFYKGYISAQREAGAHAVWMGDCNAYSGMLSLELYNELVFPPTRELIRFCEEELDMLVWLHNSEDKAAFIHAHDGLGCSLENLGPGINIVDFLRDTPPNRGITGNLDPIELLWRGSPGKIDTAARRIMDGCKEVSGYVFNTGEMNPRDTPVENMDAMMKAAKETGFPQA
jgi:uroporphyrinogen decarboxylase